MPIGAARAGVVSGGDDAIPDSAIHHWAYSEGSGSAVADNVGGLDGTLNGVTWADNNYKGGFAGEGFGTDGYVDCGIPGFGSITDTNHAVLITIDDITQNNAAFAGVSEGGAHWVIGMGERGGGEQADAGELVMNLRDPSGSAWRVATNDKFNDNTRYRVCFNKVGASGNSGIEIWVNGVERNTYLVDDQGFEGTGEFNTTSLYHFAENDSGSVQNPVDGHLDNIIVCDDALAPSEIGDDYDRQPWS